MHFIVTEEATNLNVIYKSIYFNKLKENRPIGEISHAP
jgi:hypothetical protein